MSPVFLMMMTFVSQSGASAPVLTFEQALAEAQAKNLDLQAAKAQLDQAHELSAKAWSGYLPRITVGGVYTRNSDAAEFTFPGRTVIRTVTQAEGDAINEPFPGETPPDGGLRGTPSNDILQAMKGQTLELQPETQYGGQVQVEQAVLVPPLWSAIKNAYVAEEVAELSVDNARREILFAVAQLYYGAVGLKDLLAVQERLLEATRAHERDAATRVAAGASPRISLVRAQIDRARAEQDVQRAKNSFAASKIALATMLQREDEFEVARPAEPKMDAQTPVALVAAALRDRPDVTAARRRVDLADGQHTASYLKYLPAVFASAVWRVSNATGFTGENDSWAVSLMASWSVFDGGLREAELRENEAKIVEARARARAAELKARDDVKRALLDLESARANRRKAEEQLALARENMRLVDVNYANGVATQLDVTDATTALTSAELGAVAESLNAQLAVLRLLKAAGAFNP